MNTVSKAQGRLAHQRWLGSTLVRAGLVAPLRPDKYLRMAQVIRRQGVTAMTGIGLSAARRPHATALMDERGRLTWAELEARSNALTVGLAGLRRDRGQSVAILCRNHRGFVESLYAASLLGADALLLVPAAHRQVVIAPRQPP